jgi:hypothetical protein
MNRPEGRNENGKYSLLTLLKSSDRHLSKLEMRQIRIFCLPLESVVSMSLVYQTDEPTSRHLPPETPNFAKLLILTIESLFPQHLELLISLMTSFRQ